MAPGGAAREGLAALLPGHPPVQRLLKPALGSLLTLVNQLTEKLQVGIVASSRLNQIV